MELVVYCLSSIVITSLGEDGAGSCSVSHCDHFTRGRWGWLLYCLSSTVITSLGEDVGGCCFICLAL